MKNLPSGLNGKAAAFSNKWTGVLKTIMALALLNREAMMENKVEPLIMTLRQAAELLKLSPLTLRRMIKRKHLPGAMIGSQWRIDRRELAKFIQNLEEL